MYSLSCFFLLHHHVDAAAAFTDSQSTSSGNTDDERMSDHSEDDTDRPDPTAEYHEETSSPPADTAINPVDEDNQFIFDDDSRTLICVGSHFDDVPQSIIELFAQKTKVRFALVRNPPI